MKDVKTRSKASKRTSKRRKVYIYTTTLETFYKPVAGRLQRFKYGVNIDLTGTRLISVDIETEGLNRYVDEIKSIQITDEDENSWFIWVDGNYRELENIVKFLNQFRVITHGGKFDSLFFFIKCGSSLKLYGDTQILAHMLTEPSLKLKPLIKKYFGIDYDIDKETKKSNAKQTVSKVKSDFKLWAVKNTTLTKLTQYNKVISKLHEDLNGELYITEWKQFKSFVDKDINYNKMLDYYKKVSTRVKEERRLDLVVYGMNDTLYALRLYKLLRKKIKAYKLSKVYKHEMRAYRAYIEVEKEGVTLDFDLLNETKQELEESIQRLEEELKSNKDVRKYGEINFASPKQLREFFLDYLGLEASKKTEKGEFKVDSAQLKEWDKEKKHPILPILLEWKVAVKQLQFITKWEYFAQYDGKIHPSFNITAETGRTTCNSPNLPNVGSFLEIGQNKQRELMEALLSKWVIMSQDY